MTDTLRRAEQWIKAGRPVKRSMTLAGHRTSFSLEEPFWAALKAISDESGVPMNALIARLDELRFIKGADVGLSGAIRTFVLKYFLDRVWALTGERTSVHELFEAPRPVRVPEDA